MKNMKILITCMLFLIFSSSFSQAVPAKEENIPYLVTFGKDAATSYGDDDFAQIFFC